MIDEKRIPQRIYIKDSQLAECEIEGVADARINAVPYKGGSGKLCEYINVESLWHDASEEPARYDTYLVKTKQGCLDFCHFANEKWHSKDVGTVVEWLDLADINERR